VFSILANFQLNIADCEKLTDKSIFFILGNCSQLWGLIISGNTNFTGAPFENSIIAPLKYLNIFGCTFLKEKDVINKIMTLEVLVKETRPILTLKERTFKMRQGYIRL